VEEEGVITEGIMVQVPTARWLLLIPVQRTASPVLRPLQFVLRAVQQLH
jgi:hypothetical protein